MRTGETPRTPHVTNAAEMSITPVSKPPHAMACHAFDFSIERKTTMFKFSGIPPGRRLPVYTPPQISPCEDNDAQNTFHECVVSCALGRILFRAAVPPG